MIDSRMQASEEEVENLEKGYWKSKIRDILKDWRLYVMLLPLMLFLILWKYMPISSMIMAFKYYNNQGNAGIYTSNFNGFDNFITIFTKSDRWGGFWGAFRNTFVISFYGLFFGFPFPIILALFFSEIKCTPYRAVVQIFSYLPKFISIVVVTSLIGMLLRSSSSVASAGPIGSLFENGAFHLTNLMSNPYAFRTIYIASGIWETAGYSSIVYFAAILGISPTSYEAAKIDGANKMQQIRYVTFPGMAPTLVIMLILRMGELLTVGYEKIYLLQQLGAAGSTWTTSQTISTYVINVVMGTNTNQGIGTAADLFNSLLSMCLVLGSNKIAKRVSSTSLF